MITNCRLFLLLPCLLLIGCTGQPNEPPKVLRLEVADALLTCAQQPPHPCPAPPPEPTKKPKRGPVVLVEAPPPDHFANAGKMIIERECHEKDRLRWEAMLMFRGDDCASKLRAVRDLLNVYNENAARGPPDGNEAKKKPGH